MTDQPDWFRHDLEPDVADDERALLWRVADSLIGGRPYPRAAFRANLRQRLTGVGVRPGAAPRPRLLWVRVVALALPGSALLCVVSAGLAGAGPFAT
jgi:hypothetical protein